MPKFLKVLPTYFKNPLQNWLKSKFLGGLNRAEYLVREPPFLACTQDWYFQTVSSKISLGDHTWCFCLIKQLRTNAIYKDSIKTDNIRGYHTLSQETCLVLRCYWGNKIILHTTQPSKFKKYSCFNFFFPLQFVETGLLL